MAPIESSNASENIDPDGVVGRAAATAHETVDRAAQKAQESCDRLDQFCADIADLPRDTIRTHPIASVVLALSVGYILGRLGGR